MTTKATDILTLPPSLPPLLFLQVEKCKRFLLEFEDGAFMEDEEDEEEEGIGGIPGRKKYTVFVQRVCR